LETVAVGSGNVVKVRAVEKAWMLKASATVRGFEVESGVSRQPVGVSEMLLGALNRAREALRVSGYDYGVGIEAGLLPFPSSSGYVDVQVAVIVGPGSRASLGLSPGFELPPPWVHEILIQGRELEEVAVNTLGVDRIGEKIGVIGRLTMGAVTRTDLTYQAVVMALLPWINPEIYGRPARVEELERRIQSQVF